MTMRFEVMVRCTEKDEAAAEPQAVKVSSFSRAGDEASKQMAIQVFIEKQASTPPDWKQVYRG